MPSQTARMVVPLRKIIKVKKIILSHNLDLGDAAMLSIALRDLHLAHPDRFITDVRTRWPDLWINNPYITELENDEAEIFDIGYPIIQNPGNLGFSDGHRMDLADQLKIDIPWTTHNIDIHLTNEEKKRNIVNEHFRYPGKYWVINAGYKKDAPLKYYPFWKEVAEELKNDIQLVQIGSKVDAHDDLGRDVFNLIGKTSIRELLQVIYRSEGTIGPISMQFVLGTAWGRPAVVVAGGKEPPRWQMYNNHRYLSVCGCLPCAPGNGCWTARYEDCRNRVGGVPRCFAMISPEEVARNVMLYYRGGMLKH